MAQQQLTLSNTFLQRTQSSPSLHNKVKSITRNFTFNNHRHVPTTITCKKAEIHPEFYEDAKVYCNGELVLTTGGTQKEYVVDVWSGNHPFYLGNRSASMAEADQVEKFRRKYGEIEGIMEIPNLKGEIIIPSRKKGIGKGGKKK